MSDSGKADQLKGHAKEAVGDLTDNGDLKREGAIDRAAGTAKEKAGELKDKVEGIIDSAKEKLQHQNRDQ